MSNDLGRVAVVGAGITGLTAAYALLREARNSQVTVLEADNRVGGKIATTEFAGRAVDNGADAFLARVPEAVDLCCEVGLADDLVTPASRKAYVFTRGELRAFPSGLALGVPTDLEALAGSGVVSADGVERAQRDLTMPEHRSREDESVGALVRRRVGDEVFETLVAPLLSGVYAGNADELSVAVAAPQFVAALRERGSLIAGLRAQLSRAESDAPVFYGLRGGTQQLVDALAGEIDARGGRTLLDTRVERLRESSGGWRLDDQTGGSIEADAVVITSPDYATAAMLPETVPDVSRELAAVRYASVALVVFAVDGAAFDEPPEGTGFLVPESEGLLLTACSWASSKWTHLSGDTVLLRASAGRVHDDRAFALTDDELVTTLVSDLRRTMDLPAEPKSVRVTRWPRALPQFEPGHLDRVSRWRATLAGELPGVVLAGAGIEGLGIPACVRQARDAVGQLLAGAG